MKREQRLTRSGDFRRVREQTPRAWRHPLLVLYASPNQLDRTRIGITVGKRVGKAVVRNRVRRRVREAVRPHYADLLPGYDLVFLARSPSAAATWQELRTAIETLIGQAGLRAGAQGPERA